MGSVLDAIDDHLARWIAQQPMFFVATAPLAADGHVNVSPKGPIGTLRVLGPNEVAYLDLVGSGAETVAHLRENGRIVVMLCAFQGPPRIIRLHGTGTVHLPGEPSYDELDFDAPVGEQAHRAVIRVSVDRISKSCGYSVPLMEVTGERPHTVAWTDKQLRSGGPDALERYKAENNAVSIDGLPGVPTS